MPTHSTQTGCLHTRTSLSPPSSHAHPTVTDPNSNHVPARPDRRSIQITTSGLHPGHHTSAPTCPTYASSTASGEQLPPHLSFLCSAFARPTSSRLTILVISRFFPRALRISCFASRSLSFYSPQCLYQRLPFILAHHLRLDALHRPCSYGTSNKEGRAARQPRAAPPLQANRPTSPSN